MTGNVILPDFHAARVFAQKLNAGRGASEAPERAVKAGHLNAMGLIDEILHYVLRQYEETANPGVFSRALARVEAVAGRNGARDTLLAFCTLFPPRDVYRGGAAPKAYLAAKSGAKPHAEMALEELILLFMANINPAFAPFRELFDDTELASGSAYRPMIAALEEFFRTEKRFGPDNQTVFDLLRAPMLASPDSLEGQLEFIKRRWGMILSEKFLTKLLGAGDILREESKPAVPPGGGRTPTVVPRYPPWNRSALDRSDPERFTADLDWMPRIVILAKNTYVWMDQLSKKYGRPITRLDAIPDEELDRLARWNITGLWLIGIWERSPASRQIKQMTGNPEAVASAYSIYDYEIAAELGGEEAFLNLRHRAWERGIRMAGDMVPNHMGLYSRWVVEHPGYFIQSDVSPFPNYRFSGPNLSGEPGVELRIEDGYWARSDAAVVFQRIDTHTGGTRYIYHGNDGTNMPWNDTAQLDFLKAEVREAVIRTILHVAGKFSIIRFDAAMTLTRQHFQRLWYPPPGSGGDIPSRAGHALGVEEFDRAFPAEFWREVVDRINAEMPETLLLAEAFWLLEGYFVRTLGMHRVYNSAFMHMLMREENEKYRSLIKNTLAFNPEILKRYVNFMSNPDEETAIAQFGSGDRYFGVAIMMVTLPGLPMIAHGQVEGFREKYGMEYKRAYYDEGSDEELVRRHERELFPLMQKRRLFSHVEHFELYDLVGPSGGVNENVFAYSNREGDERALIFYHNAYEECAGWVKRAVPKVEPQTGGGDRRLGTKDLGDALALDAREGMFHTFRERTSGLEFIRSGAELRDRGMYVHLRAFQYQVFMEFRQVFDDSGDFARLAASLEGRGVPDILEALIEMRLKPVQDAFRDMFDDHSLKLMRALGWGKPIPEGVHKKDVVSLVERYERFLVSVSGYLGGARVSHSAVPKLRADLKQDLERLLEGESLPSAPGRPHPAFLLVWFLTAGLGRLVSKDDVPAAGAALIDTLRLGPMNASRAGEGAEDGASALTAGLLRLLIRFQLTCVPDSEADLLRGVREMLDDPGVQAHLGVNSHEGVMYYNKESFETLLGWLFFTGSLIRACEAPPAQRFSPTTAAGGSAQAHSAKILALSERSGYRLEELRRLLEVPAIPHTIS